MIFSIVDNLRSQFICFSIIYCRSHAPYVDHIYQRSAILHYYSAGVAESWRCKKWNECMYKQWINHCVVDVDTDKWTYVVRHSINKKTMAESRKNIVMLCVSIFCICSVYNIPLECAFTHSLTHRSPEKYTLIQFHLFRKRQRALFARRPANGLRAQSKW